MLVYYQYLIRQAIIKIIGAFLRLRAAVLGGDQCGSLFIDSAYISQKRNETGTGLHIRKGDYGNDGVLNIVAGKGPDGEGAAVV